MNRSTKFYIFFTILFGFSIAAVRSADQVSNYYENSVATNVCEGDSNIIKAGCSVAVGQVVRVTPGVLTGVTIDKMGDCFNKYKSSASGASGAVIDLNDPCNQIAMYNPAMKKENFAYLPINDDAMVGQSRSGFTAFVTQLEVINKKATTGGLLLDHNYFAAQTFKEVPFLQKSYAAAPSEGYNKITTFVYEVWTLSRNISYLILLIASLGIGIIIMLGNTDKDNKTKLSVELAIPRVVIAVILISSSYWIGELVLTALLGGGIIQSFAAFFSQALFPVTINGGWDQAKIYMGMAAATGIMGAIALITTSTGGAGIIPIIFALAMAVYQIFYVNLLILKNIFDLLVYIIYSPFVLIGGVIPSDTNYLAFRKHGQKLVKFIAIGFLLSLINFGSKAFLGYTMLQNTTSTTTGLFSGANDIYNGTGLSSWLVAILGLAGYIAILYQAKKVEDISEKFAAKMFNTTEKKDKDKDK